MTCSQARRQLWPTPIAGAPAVFELGQPVQRRLGVLSPVDRLQIGHDLLAVLPGDKGHRAADQVNDAGLDQGLGEHRPDRLGKGR